MQRIDPAMAMRWRPYYRGPRELWLRCRGSAFARLVAALHFHWPFARGQARMNRILRSVDVLSRRLRAVPFRSACGVDMKLDIASEAFMHLSGRLPPEPLEITLMSRLAREGDIFVDVGAHWGLYIPHILGRLGGEGRYIAIEPGPRNLAVLRATFGESPGPLRILGLAVADFSGTTYLHGDGLATGYVSEVAEDGVPVAVDRLDRLLCDVDGSRSVFVKVDTEGHEAAVIRGCKGLAERHVEPTFLLEYLPEIHGQARDRIGEALAATFGAGYQLWAVDQHSGRISRLPAGVEPAAGVRNVLAVPAAQAARVAALGAP